MNEFGRIVSAPLSIEFSEASLDEKAFRKEYEMLAETDEDPIGQWLKLAKARGDTRDSDMVLLHLTVELHRKVDELKKMVAGEITTYLDLQHGAELEGVGHGIFQLETAEMETSQEYYGRINLPVFPQRIVPLYFRAIDSVRAKIQLMHERDVREWDSYIAARDRAKARELRGRNA